MTVQPRRYSWFYWFIVAMTIPMMVLFAFHVIDFITHPLAPDQTYDSVVMRLFLVLGVVPAALIVSILVLRRARGNVCGLFLIQWAMLIMGNTMRLDSPIAPYQALNVGWVGLWLLPLYFPDGRAIPLRFEHPIQILSAAFMVIVVVWGLAQPTIGPASGNVVGEIQNPLFIPFLAPFQGLINVLDGVLMFVNIAMIIPSVILRFRASDRLIRQQMKWIAWVFVVIILTVIPIAISGITLKAPSALSTIELMVSSVWGLFITIAPFIAVGNAILRYRLYDIDLIIRRTLVYTILSGILAVIYFGGIVLAQQAFQLVTGQGSDLVIVISTLLIAALFTPIRRRVQEVIDRRLYRRKYESEKTLQCFNETLRDEVNLDQLKQALAEVVDDTMQPARLAVWVRVNPHQEAK